jgi:pyruvate formate lyase activating enzyme
VLRVAVIPGINDDEANIRCTGAFAASLPHLAGVSLLPYHNTAVHKYANLNRAYQLHDDETPDMVTMETLAETLRSYGLAVKIGG